jgi:bifunctional enzyme CysN/CysC
LFDDGEFLEVFVDTSLFECEKRDVKGLSAKARKGELKNFTGIDSPYEKPDAPDVHLFTEQQSPESCVETLFNKLII